MDSRRTVRIGIIGFGMIGKVHAYAWNSLPFFFPELPIQGKITHLVTSRQQTAEAARQTLNADVASTNFREITENPSIDIVHICSPNSQHGEALLSAMKHQKAIYCDKPMVATWNEAVQVAAALPDYHQTSQMTFQTRFVGAVQRAKALIDEGRIGRVLSFRFTYLHGGNASPNAPMKWKLSAQSGGGVIADLASHLLDLAEFLLGPLATLTAQTSIAYPQRPSAVDSNRLSWVDTEDHVCAIVHISGGGLGTLEATKIATGTEDELRFEIHGTEGALRFSLMEPHYLDFFDATVAESAYGGERGWKRIAVGRRYASPAVAFPSTKSAVGWLEGHILCLGNFVQHFLSEDRGNPSLEQGVRVQKLMRYLRISAKENRTVACDEDVGSSII
ncbi:MAG: Gfo/Idh/MocA family oxidoreductase [Thermoguttaceae bacterium]|nr:Gfo/Idh/MocA family oxidoreductase [Thermoguttaceae bacterium]